MKNRSCRTLMLTAFLCASLIQLAFAKPPGEEFVYKQADGRALSLYVTRPGNWKESDRRPAVVFFHGGAWVGGQPGQFDEHSKYLASRGLICFQVQYRLLDRKKKDPPTICIQDARSAMRWVRSRATQFGIDPQRVASAGGSAGGHLAAFVGLVDGSDDPQDDVSVSARSQAMVLFNPVFDNGPGGWGVKRVGDQYLKLSPLHNIRPEAPPAIVFLGTQDKLIPVATGKRFQKLMREAGSACKLMLFEGKGHGFFNHGRHENRPFVETLTATDRFLAELGWLDGEPTLSEH